MRHTSGGDDNVYNTGFGNKEKARESGPLFRTIMQRTSYPVHIACPGKRPGDISLFRGDANPATEETGTCASLPGVSGFRAYQDKSPQNQKNRHNDINGKEIFPFGHGTCLLVFNKRTKKTTRQYPFCFCPSGTQRMLRPPPCEREQGRIQRPSSCRHPSARRQRHPAARARRESCFPFR